MSVLSTLLRPSHTTFWTQLRLKEFISCHKGTWKLPSTEALLRAFLLTPSPKHDLVCPPKECYNGREEKPKSLPLSCPDWKRKYQPELTEMETGKNKKQSITFSQSFWWNRIFPIHISVISGGAADLGLYTPGLLHLRAIYRLQLLMGTRALSVLLAALSLHVLGWFLRTSAHFPPADATYEAKLWTALYKEAFGTCLES